MNLRINLMDMTFAGDDRTPADVVRELGLRYARWESHPIADQIHLINVDESSLPASLPSFITKF